MSDFLTAVGLVFAIEGLVYAIAPAALKQMMAVAIETPESTLRTFGIVALAFGVGLVWMIRG